MRRATFGRKMAVLVLSVYMTSWTVFPVGAVVACNKNLKELRNIRKYLPLYWEKLKDLQRQLERPMKGFYKGQPRGVFELGERFMKEEAEHEKAQEIPAPGQALDV